MRIDGQSLNRVSSLPPAAQTQAATATKAAARPSAGSREEVSLSPTGQLVMAAQQALRGVPEVREERTRGLQAAMDSGRYQPDAEAVAAAMVGE